MEIFITLAISLGLGLLIGLQRERTEARLGGIRTFPLISLFGSFCGLLGAQYGGWIIAAGFFTLFGTLALSDILAIRREVVEPGQTTEVAALLTFALGAYLVSGNRAVAIVAAGVMAVLLHLKAPMHRWVDTMGAQDMTAIMQFVVISLIILPLLPNQVFGPYGVLNPFDIWRMVVLIVGISLAGYIAYKLLGQGAGTLLGGVLGGMISSTATTVSFARRAKAAAHAYKLAVVVILIASAIAYVRVLMEIGLIAPAFFGHMALPIAVMLVWMSLLAVGAYMISQGESEEMPQPSNPAELKSALVFGAIYAAVLLALGAAKQHLGTTALYGIAVISGLTDMDAITVSTARMVEDHRIEAGMGWRLILVASLANLVFKGAAAAFLGGRRLALRLLLFFGIAMAGGLVLLWLWPENWRLALPVSPTSQ